MFTPCSRHPPFRETKRFLGAAHVSRGGVLARWERESDGAWPNDGQPDTPIDDARRDGVAREAGRVTDVKLSPSANGARHYLD